MRIAVCFFGEMSFMDRFMIQSVMRCLIDPFHKYIKKDVEFSYFLHTFFQPDVLTWIGMMRALFPFSSVTLHDREKVLVEKPDDVDTPFFLRDYSFHRVKKKWKNYVENLDRVMMVRLDLLFTKPLTENDVDQVLHQKRHLFLHHGDNPFFAIGDPMVMNVFTDQLHHLPGTSFLEMMRAQYGIKVDHLSLVMVRILPDAIVCPEDYQICPYLSDLIASSTTKIRMIRRKTTLKSEK